MPRRRRILYTEKDKLGFARLRHASVAQLVEQGTENPRVVGSIPIGGTIPADLAHLVERDLAKVEVAGSSPVIRSKSKGSGCSGTRKARKPAKRPKGYCFSRFLLFFKECAARAGVLSSWMRSFLAVSFPPARRAGAAPEDFFCCAQMLCILRNGSFGSHERAAKGGDIRFYLSKLFLFLGKF